MAEFNRLCASSKLDAYCNTGTVVARKERGRGMVGPDMYSEPQWRCFSFKHFGRPNDSICIGDCGQEIECNGGAVGAASTVHITWDALPAKIKELKAELCRE